MIRRTIGLGLLALLLLPAGGRASDKAGDIVSLRGSAVVERQNQELPAQRRMALLTRDQVVTGEQARLKMLFRDDSILTLGAQSRLIVEKYLFSEGDRTADSIFQLLDGKLRAVVGSEGFMVRTPTALAAARGTVLLAWHNALTATSSFAVLEGQLELRSGNPLIPGVQILNAGETARVPSGLPPSPPAPFRSLSELGNEVVEVSDPSGADLVEEVVISEDLTAQLPTRVEPVIRPVLQPVEEVEPPPLPPLNQTPESRNLATTPVTVEFIFDQPQ